MRKIKIGKRRIELAARHWEMIAICDESEKQNYKGYHFDKAYREVTTDFGIIEEELPKGVGVYVKANATDISKIVIDEVKRYRRRYKHGDTFLLNIYKQIIKGNSGIYNYMFKEGCPEVFQLLNYFIDEMREKSYFDKSWDTQIEKLETKMRERLMELEN